MACVTRCSDCPFPTSRTMSATSTHGASSAEIAFVGGRPDRSESSALTGGYAGKILTAVLEDVGLSKVPYSLHNARSCVTPMTATKDSVKESFEPCRTRIQAELVALPKAKILVPMGPEALKACGIKGSLHGNKTAQRGNNFHHEIDGRSFWTFPTVHPSLLKVNPRYTGIFKIDLDRVAKAHKHGRLDWDEGRINLEPTVEDVEAFAELADQLDYPVALDVETAGFGFQAPLTCIGFSCDGDTIVVPLLTWGDDYDQRKPAWFGEDSRRVKEAIQRICSYSRLTMQNGQYDCSVLEHNGFRVASNYRRRGYDTYGAAYVIASELPRSLGELGSYYTDSPRWKGMVDHGDHNHDWAWELVYRKYNALDNLVTDRVRAAQEPFIARDATNTSLNRRFMDLQDVARKMTMRGIPLDPGATDKHLCNYRTKLDTASKDFQAIAPDINPQSPQQLRELLFVKMGAPVHHLTDSGEPSTDGDALAALAEYPDPQVQQVVSALLRHRELSKVTSMLTSLEGRKVAHPQWNVGRITSGRWACNTRFLDGSNGPSFQIIPFEFRDIIRAPEGHTLIAPDWKQLEMRVKGYLADCEPLIDGFENGDPHDSNARLIFDIPEGTAVTKRVRTLTKNFWYGQDYGGGAGVIHDTITGFNIDGEFPFKAMTVKQIRSMMAKVGEKFPQLGVFSNWYFREAQRRGFAWEFLDGRKRYFLDGFERTEVINHPIQGTAGALANRAILTLDELLPDTLIMQVHDELVVCVKDADVPHAVDCLKAAMEQEVKLEGPFKTYVKSFPVDVAMGPTWKDCK